MGKGKRWLVPILVTGALVVLALSARWWLPRLLTFVGTNSDLIQGLTDSVQLLIWAGALLAFLLGLWRGYQKPKPEHPSIHYEATAQEAGTIAQDRSVVVEPEGQAVVDSTVYGDVLAPGARKEVFLGTTAKEQQPTTGDGESDEFLKTRDYLDVESKDFGRHSLSSRLLEEVELEYRLAQSWVSFVLYPVEGNCKIETFALKDKLNPASQQRIWRGDQWYHTVPKPFWSAMFLNPRANPKEFLGTWQPGYQNIEGFLQFIQIQPTGHIEIGCTYPLFYRRDGVRFFAFVNLVGYLWQILYLSKTIYCDAGFYGDIAVLLNLIGTKDTRLASFASGWASPFSPERGVHSEQEICPYLNIQIKREITLAGASDSDIETEVRKIAQELGAYYGQDRPRCFDYSTGEFPVRDYTSVCCGY